MFKVIESDEEFEAALAAGLLWMNEGISFPRADFWWRPVRPADLGRARDMWRIRSKISAGCYMPEDFAVLVEEEGE